MSTHYVGDHQVRPVVAGIVIEPLVFLEVEEGDYVVVAIGKPIDRRESSASARIPSTLKRTLLKGPIVFADLFGWT
jgi:hypothetical protein